MQRSEKYVIQKLMNGNSLDQDETELFDSMIDNMSKVEWEKLFKDLGLLLFRGISSNGDDRGWNIKDVN